ncbi:MAG: alpha/beta hydrolase fold domain-containing protein [Caulobacteraceae bacterium]|nr:alpha/beta hydrolase fold domain-containing protein [Caulobacteraceae bacterium]
MARSVGLAVIAATLFSGLSAAAEPAKSPIPLDPDGTVHAPAMDVPLSNYLSPEARAYVNEHLHQMERPELLTQRDGVPIFMEGYLARQRALFGYIRSDVTLAGVHAFEYRPKNGYAKRNERRVLINLHGGGFSGCFPGCAELESIPIAALGRIRVVSLDYREGPDHQFPAASEDVAAVYRHLLKHYPARNIGIYGCSAGGMLTGQAVAWFQAHGLPRPGAVGIFCAGGTMTSTGFGGDAAYFNGPLGDAQQPPAPPKDDAPKLAPMAYFAKASPTDPLVSPAISDTVLKAFPPTLIITGTRGFELSSAVYTHSRLVRVGVDAELHVWEGLFHGFFYNADVPESRDCYDVINRFFDRHLGR